MREAKGSSEMPPPAHRLCLSGPAELRQRWPRTRSGLGTLLRSRVGWLALMWLGCGVLMPSSALATFAGRNGVLLVGAPVGSRPFASQPPRAHTADCTAEPSELWSVRPDGSHPVDLGPGDDGIFSPGGKRLAVAYSGDPCWGYFDDVQGPDPAAGLFLSRSDGSYRHRIAGEGIAGWLPDGRLVDGTTSGNSLRLFEAETGRTVVRLQVPHLQAVSMSCSGRVAVTSAIRGGVELAVYTPERVRSSSRQQVTVVKQRVSVAAAHDGLDDPQWAPDGRTVLFERIDASGSGTLWRADVNGRHMRRLSPQHGADDSSGN